LVEPRGHYRHIILAFISSKTPPDLQDTDFILPATHPDFAATGLSKTSTIRLHRLATLTTAIIIREMGELSPVLQIELDKRLRRLFGL
jgi:mRNA interferase MazF